MRLEQVEGAGLRGGRGRIGSAQHGEHGAHLVEGTEARKCVEGVAHRDDELGLVELVLVVAVVSAEREALGLLAGEAGAGLRGRRVRLQ
ncbi:hypothetical protein [Agromyces endophyticus]|uniref:hypothetical protein n=1 Tax=Agromyces sp. H17E-10 TaxID=2932244 RepID=UPI00351D84D7